MGWGAIVARGWRGGLGCSGCSGQASHAAWNPAVGQELRLSTVQSPGCGAVLPVSYSPAEQPALPAWRADADTAPLD